MKTLYVSRDCGVQYSVEMKSESLDEILKRANKLSAFRWYIEDENGVMDHEHLCPIHLGLIILLTRKNMPSAKPVTNKEES